MSKSKKSIDDLINEDEAYDISGLSEEPDRKERRKPRRTLSARPLTAVPSKRLSRTTSSKPVMRHATVRQQRIADRATRALEQTIAKSRAKSTSKLAKVTPKPKTKDAPKPTKSAPEPNPKPAPTQAKKRVRRTRSKKFQDVAEAIDNLDPEYSEPEPKVESKPKKKPTKKLTKDDKSSGPSPTVNRDRPEKTDFSKWGITFGKKEGNLKKYKEQVVEGGKEENELKGWVGVPRPSWKYISGGTTIKMIDDKDNLLKWEYVIESTTNKSFRFSSRGKKSAQFKDIKAVYQRLDAVTDLLRCAIDDLEKENDRLKRFLASKFDDFRYP